MHEYNPKKPWGKSAKNSIAVYTITIYQLTKHDLYLKTCDLCWVLPVLGIQFCKVIPEIRSQRRAMPLSPQLL